MAVIPSENSNSLVFLDKNRWSDELLKLEVPPAVVLLTAWEKKDVVYQQIEPLITKLIDLGCMYFVCVGRYSEQLHDSIDDVILDMSISNKQESYSDITTTWHDTDTDDEVAEFFLHSTSVSNSLLVAFLDERKLEDGRLRKAIVEID